VFTGRLQLRVAFLGEPGSYRLARSDAAAGDTATSSYGRALIVIHSLIEGLMWPDDESHFQVEADEESLYTRTGSPWLQMD
jgi:hypothetical protein